MSRLVTLRRQPFEPSPVLSKMNPIKQMTWQIHDLLSLVPYLQNSLT